MNTNKFLDLSNELNVNLINLESFSTFLTDHNISYNTLPISLTDMLVIINTSPIQCAAIFRSYDSPIDNDNSIFIPKLIYLFDAEFKRELAIKYHKNRDSNNSVIRFLDDTKLFSSDKWLSNWNIGNRSFASISDEELISLEDFEKLSFKYEGDFQFFEELNYLFIKVNDTLLFTNPIILNNPFSKDELVYVDLALFREVDEVVLNDIFTQVAEADLIAKDFSLVFKTIAVAL